MCCGHAKLGTSIENDRWTTRADHLRETPAAVRFISAEPLLGPLPSLDLTGIAWLIVGGESGRGARPMDLGWVRDLIAMARANGTATFVKQLGSVWAGRGHGGDPERWPEDLRVREWPAAPPGPPGLRDGREALGGAPPRRDAGRSVAQSRPGAAR